MKPKFSIYQYLNFILTGLIFSGCTIVVFSKNVDDITLIKNISGLSLGIETIIVFIMIGIIYELGFIINRIGSILIEPIYKKLHFVKFNDDYKRFNEAKKDYPILDVLSREYALSRTQISLYLILAILSIIKHQWILLIIFLLLVLLFSISMFKHSKKIVNLMS